jgi:hypothetical protein
LIFAIQEDDNNLASANGMNHFASLVILCQVKLIDFLEMGAEERLGRFSSTVGHERMVYIKSPS